MKTLLSFFILISSLNASAEVFQKTEEVGSWIQSRTQLKTLNIPVEVTDSDKLKICEEVQDYVYCTAEIDRAKCLESEATAHSVVLKKLPHFKLRTHIKMKTKDANGLLTTYKFTQDYLNEIDDSDYFEGSVESEKGYVDMLTGEDHSLTVYNDYRKHPPAFIIDAKNKYDRDCHDDD